MGLASKEQSKERLAICKECKFYKLRTCTKCGCFMPFKTKLKGQECPEGKWM